MTNALTAPDCSDSPRYGDVTVCVANTVLKSLSLGTSRAMYMPFRVMLCHAMQGISVELMPSMKQAPGQVIVLTVHWRCLFIIVGLIVPLSFGVACCSSIVVMKIKLEKELKLKLHIILIASAAVMIF